MKKLPLFLCVLVFCASAFTCERRTEEDDYQNFVRAIETADEVGYKPYWLGRNFTHEGITFFGPSMPDFGGEIVGGVGFTYDAPLDRGGGDIEIILISDSAWADSGFSGSPRAAGTTVKTVTVVGVQATLLFIPAGTRPINQTALIMEIAGTHIVARAHSGGAVTPGGPDSNPLIYEDAFLSVVEQLRPYPD
jgi:hypothetical protein